MKLYPSKKQWKGWNLPSKLTAIGAYLAIIFAPFCAIDAYEKICDLVLPAKYLTVAHDGTLNVKVLKGTYPQKFIGAYVNCAKGEDEVHFQNGVTEYEVTIHEETETAYINCRMNKDRWLADATTPPLVMNEHSLEVNGTIIPAKYVEKTLNGKSANFVFRPVLK